MGISIDKLSYSVQKQVMDKLKKQYKEQSKSNNLYYALNGIKPPKEESKSKYHNQKTESGFDSKKEEKRYNELLLLQRAGLITDLQRQVKYELIPKQSLERAVYYYADFQYKDEDGKTIVEDVKSPATKTKVYIIKRKLMLWRFGIEIKEIE